uniref:Uncharacterized protein n=1 Tax=Romanomermis culicivorax TaxID=13658 RepID=A0A915IJI1_ROMCU
MLALLLFFTFWLHFSCPKSVRNGAASFQASHSMRAHQNVKTFYQTVDDGAGDGEDDDNSARSNSGWSIFYKSRKHFDASEKFRRFIDFAETAQISGKNGNQMRIYYFLKAGVDMDQDLVDDNEVCEFEAQASSLIPTNGYFENPSEIIPLYFLCLEYCCKEECCEINQLFLGCLIFLVVLIVNIAVYAYCRLCARAFPVIRRPQELAALRCYKSKFKNGADKVLFTERMAKKIFNRPPSPLKSEPPEKKNSRCSPISGLESEDTVVKGCLNFKVQASKCFY